jgi:hypothetical protein
MPLPIPLWFVQGTPYDRRRPANRLKRATMEAEMLEERQINLWLELGTVALEGDALALPHAKTKETAA